MAVISELIDAGLALKEQGNHQAAIEHFRQLNSTYPNHARIMFELAGSWQAFGVPEQAIPLYQQLMAMPKSQGLNPKAMPRLYTQLGASLRLVGKFAESLEIVKEGISLFPEYRPLRAYYMFALHSAGFHQNAMLEALDLMLDSLAPSKWDLYEEEIIGIVGAIRERVPSPSADDLDDWEFDEFWTEEGQQVTPDIEANDSEEVSTKDVLDEANAIVDTDDIDETDVSSDKASIPKKTSKEDKIPIEDHDKEIADNNSFEIQVKVVDKKKPKPKSKKKSRSTQKKDGQQFGKKPVKIDIGDTDEGDSSSLVQSDAESDSDDDTTPPPSGKINIPIDLD